MSNTDNLKCGNCGYDGGVGHAQEKLQWQKELHKAQREADIDSSVRTTRATVAGIALTLSVLIVSLSHCTIAEQEIAAKRPPEPQPIPLTVEQQAQRTLTVMYDNCIRNAQGTSGISACNETFKTQIGNLKTTAGE